MLSIQKILIPRFLAVHVRLNSRRYIPVTMRQCQKLDRSIWKKFWSTWAGEVGGLPIKIISSKRQLLAGRFTLLALIIRSQKSTTTRTLVHRRKVWRQRNWPSDKARRGAASIVWAAVRQTPWLRVKGVVCFFRFKECSQAWSGLTLNIAFSVNNCCFSQRHIARNSCLHHKNENHLQQNSLSFEKLGVTSKRIQEKYLGVSAETFSAVYWNLTI
jgi:hypothetical protein